jgi:tetratricopeptide (TPR) repeat protein
MTGEAHDSELTALRVELDSLLGRDPSPRAETLCRRLRALAGQMEAAGDPEASEQMCAALFSAAVLASMSGRLADAEADYRAAIPYAERVLEGHPEDAGHRDRLASLHYNLGNLCSSTGRLPDAEAAYRTALPHQEANVRALPEEPVLRNHLAQTRFNLGNTCLSLGRASEAAGWFRAAGELWSKLVEEQPEAVGHAHNLARSYFNRAYAAAEAGDVVEALDAYPRGQEVWLRLLREHGEDLGQRCDLARCCYNHSLLLAQTGRHDEAVAASERGLPHFDRLVELAPADRNLAALRRQAHEHHQRLLANPPEQVAARQVEEGERLAAPARAAADGQRLRQLGLGHLETARAFRQTNRPVEMEQVSRAAIRLVAEAAALDPTPDTANLEAALWFDLNIDLRELGRYDGAEEAVRAALRRWRRLHARHPEDPRFRHWLAGAYNNLGIICADTGRPEAAEAAYREALARREEAARSAAEDAENQLFLGGALCNLGNVYLDRGQLETARTFYERALRTLEPLPARLPGNALVGQFLKKSRGGRAECGTRTPVDAGRFGSATVTWAQPGPPALTIDAADAALADAVRRADALRLAGDPAAEQATAGLVARAPDCAEAWLLRGLVLGEFRTETGGQTVTWQDERHQEATAAFYEALVCRLDYYEAKLYKGLALRQAAHAAQAGLRALHDATAALSEAEREGLLAPRRQRFRWDVARARESLEAAARLRPADARAWSELVELYHGLGYEEEARPYRERLRSVASG